MQVKKGSKTNKENKGLKSVLCQAAWAAMKAKGSRTASFYYRIVKRRGPKKANMALAHLLLRIVYQMLLNKVPYKELGWDYLPKKEKSLDYWVRQIQGLGFNVLLQEQKLI